MKTEPRRQRLLSVQLLLIFLFAAFLSAPRPAEAGPVGRVARKAAQLADDFWRPARDAGSDVAHQARRWYRGVDDVPKAFREYLEKNGDSLPDVFRTRVGWELAAESPELIPYLEKASRRFPGRELGRLLETLETFRTASPTLHDSLVRDVLPKLDDRNFVTLSRGLRGKTISSSALESALDFPDLAKYSTLRGELFEELAKHQIAGGSLSRYGLRLGRNTGVISGQFGRQGIDGIAVSDKGVPVILEFTLGKDLKKATARVDGKDVPQMSKEWIVSRWESLLKDESRVQQLQIFGIDERFLDLEYFERHIEEVHRVIVTSKEGGRRVRNAALVRPRPEIMSL